MGYIRVIQYIYRISNKNKTIRTFVSTHHFVLNFSYTCNYCEIGGLSITYHVKEDPEVSHLSTVSKSLEFQLSSPLLV